MARVAVVGVGQTKYEGRTDGLSLQDLIFSAASAALRDAGVKRDELDSVVLGAQDVVDGRGISNMQNAGPAGGYLKDEIRVADDGIYALILAYLQMLAGRSRLALVVSWSKPSETNMDRVSAAEFEPFFQRPIGLIEKCTLGIQAAELLRASAAARSAASVVVCQARAAGRRNPLAHLTAPVTAAEVEASDFVSWPLRRLDLCPASDGACALVLATEERAARLSPRPAWVRGVGWSTDEYEIGERSLTESRSLAAAAAQAYREAGLASAQEVDLVETGIRSTFQQLVVLEALSACPPGGAVEFVLGGQTGFEGRLPVNPSGGPLVACPSAAVGLVRVAEVALQLMRRGGDHQLDHAQVGVAHGSTGQCLQSNGVVVLGATP